MANARSRHNDTACPIAFRQSCAGTTPLSTLFPSPSRSTQSTQTNSKYFPCNPPLKAHTMRPGEGAPPMPITHQTFPQSRIIPHIPHIPHPNTALTNDEHLGPTMIAFREITTFFSKTMIAFREKPHFHPSIPTKTRKKSPQIQPSSPPPQKTGLAGLALPAAPFFTAKFAYPPIRVTLNHATLPPDISP